MQSDWVILMKLSSNLPGREMDGGGGKKQAFSLITVSVDPRHSHRKEQMDEEPELTMNQVWDSVSATRCSREEEHYDCETTHIIFK